MTSTKTDKYLVKMASGSARPGNGEGFYHASCGKCAYHTIRYRFPVDAETDVQDHLWHQHQVATFLARS